MRRQEIYTDAGLNPIMQQFPAQQLSENSYSTQDPLRPSDAHYSGASRRAEGQWHWDRDTSKDPNKISSYPILGQGKAASHNYIYEAQRLDLNKLGTEKAGNSDPNNAALEGAYEDNAALPQKIDALEQRFLRDLTKLLKEQHDAEDAEFSRHRERLNEISAQYQEKLAAMRAQQGKIRDEFLIKESQSRKAHFQNNNTSPPPLTSGTHHNNYPPYSTEAPPQRTASLYGASYGGAEGGYHPGGYGGDAAPLQGAYPTPASNYESGGGHAHGRGFESRYPGGRPYNAGGRQH